MARLEKNNPTERIGRLLDDVEELLDYAQELRELAIKHGLGADLPSEPPLREVSSEKIRRQYTLKRVRTARLAVRRTRYRQAQGYHIRGTKDYDPAFDEDILQEAGLSEKVKRELQELMEGEDE